MGLKPLTPLVGIGGMEYYDCYDIVGRYYGTTQGAFIPITELLLKFMERQGITQVKPNTHLVFEKMKDGFYSAVTSLDSEILGLPNCQLDANKNIQPLDADFTAKPLSFACGLGTFMSDIRLFEVKTSVRFLSNDQLRDKLNTSRITRGDDPNGELSYYKHEQMYYDTSYRVFEDWGCVILKDGVSKDILEKPYFRNLKVFLTYDKATVHGKLMMDGFPGIPYMPPPPGPTP